MIVASIEELLGEERKRWLRWARLTNADLIVHGGLDGDPSGRKSAFKPFSGAYCPWPHPHQAHVARDVNGIKVFSGYGDWTKY